MAGMEQKGQLSGMPPSGIIAIVPMKPLASAKSRLAKDLTDDQRMALSANLLRQVLSVLREPLAGTQDASPVGEIQVVGGDETIRKVSESCGADWFEDEGTDINETLNLSFSRAFEQGKAALFLPGDLPFLKPRDVHGIVGASGHLKNVTLAPARQGGGTNGILVVPGLPQPFEASLGPDSFSRHLAQASSKGISVAMYYSPGMGFDLDTYDDLRTYEYMEPGLMNRLTEGAYK